MFGFTALTATTKERIKAAPTTAIRLSTGSPSGSSPPPTSSQESPVSAASERRSVSAVSDRKIKVRFSKLLYFLANFF